MKKYIKSALFSFLIAAYCAVGFAAPTAVAPAGALNVLTFGASNTCTNGAATAAAFNAAMAASKDVYVPTGTYCPSALITVPTYTRLWGASESGTIIEPTSAINGGPAILFLGSLSLIQNMTIDGTNTIGSTGVQVGDTSLRDEAVLRNLMIKNFGGVGGQGMEIVNMVRAGFYDLYITANTTDLNIGSNSTSSYPDSLHFYNSVFHSSTGGPGVIIRQGFEITFTDCTAEANWQAGYLVTPGAGELVFNLAWHGGWNEANWQSVAAGAGRQAEYGLDLVGNVGTINHVVIDGGYFNGSPGAQSAIRANGVYYLSLYAPVTAQQPGAISTLGNTTGWIWDYQDSGGNFVDSTGLMFSNDAKWANVNSAWTAYVPTYASSAGNAATTFSGAVTTNVARYKIIGKTLYLQYGFTGTLNAVTPSYLSLTLPATASAQSNNIYGASNMVDNNAQVAGGFYRASTTSLLIEKLNAAAFTASSVVGGSGLAVIELQ